MVWQEKEYYKTKAIRQEALKRYYSLRAWYPRFVTDVKQYSIVMWTIIR